MKYRKKPLEVHAIKWEGKDIRQLDELFKLGVDGNCPCHMGSAEGDGDLYELVIFTLEGPMHADVGDYVIRGIAGELYPCKPEIFEASYDVVED